MTEIPEHLLKRSQARRGAAAASSDSGSDASPAKTEAAAQQSSAPAATGRAAAPAPQPPEAAKPDSPVVAAYKRRNRIPGWAMLGLAFLPLWAFMYVRAVTVQPKQPTGPLAVGTAAYSGCASCHGAKGEGVAGLGYQFTDGEVLKTFPHIEDQLRFVYFGTAAYNSAGVEIYGDPNRPGGAHVTGQRGVMPGQGANAGGGLTDAEILGVVCHERFDLGGASEDPAYEAEFELWCSPEAPMYAALEAGTSTLANLSETVADPATIPIGDAPVAGSAAG